MGGKRQLPSMETLAALEAIDDIITLRNHVRHLGVDIKYLQPSGEWACRRRDRMLLEVGQLLKSSRARDAIRSLAAEFGVKRYKSTSSGRRTNYTWRTIDDIQADVNKAVLSSGKNCLPSLFGRQLKAGQDAQGVASGGNAFAGSHRQEAESSAGARQ